MDSRRRRPAQQLVGRGCAVILVIAALVWPAFYNGQPFFHTDTSAYLRGADAGIQKLTHRTTAWSLPADDSAAAGSAARDGSTASSTSSIRDKTILSGRSPYYGILLYLGELTGGFWVSVVTQACAVLLALPFAVRVAGLPAWPVARLSAALLAVASSAPFYVSFLMPDVFAGVLIIGISVLLAVRRVLPWSDYLVWFALCTAAMVFHESHLIIAIGMLCLGIAWNLWAGWSNSGGVGVIVAAIVVANAAQLALDVAVKRLVGAPPLVAPFLTARLIDDGPGYRYLKATCPANGFAVCGSIASLPMSANQFLWSPDGVFSAAAPELRRQLAAEHLRFALAVIRYEPLGVLKCAVSDALTQVTMSGLENFQLEDTGRRNFERKIPEEHLQVLRHSAAYRGVMPTRLYSIINTSVLAAAALFLIWFALKGGIGRSAPATAGIVGWIIVGVLVDAVVCGVFSGPHIRYSERVQWLVLFAASLVAAARLWERGERGGMATIAPAAAARSTDCRP